MTTEQVRKIVAYTVYAIENTDCSCSFDEGGTCWYHMTDDERINAITQWFMASCIEKETRETN